MTTLSIDAAGATPKIAVWDLPTRIFHWTLALSFAGAYLTAESERWRDVHVMLGYTLLGLIGFRLVWGLIGTRYARFASFVAGPRRIVAYLRSLFAAAPEHHVGHNPAGALAILLLLGLGVAAGVSGWAVYNDVGGEWLEELHEGAANAMLAVVVIHVLGVIVSSFVHRENLIGAMITGNKNGAPAAAIATRHRAVGIALLGAVLGFWGLYLAANPAEPGGAAPAVQGERMDSPHAGKGGRDHDD